MNLKSIPKLRPAERIANSFTEMLALGVRNREIYSSILRSALENNSDFVGVWTVWEPDALDGLDRQYRNTPGHDNTGRMVNFWQRRDDHIQLDPVTAYDAGDGPDWYRVPQQTQKMHVMGPYMYPIAGVECQIMSQVAPIVHNGKGIGVAGIDISIESWAEGAIRGENLCRSDVFDDTLDHGCVLLDESKSVVHLTTRAKRLLERHYKLSDSLPARLPEGLSYESCKPQRVQSSWTTKSPALSVEHLTLPVQCHSILLVTEACREEDVPVTLTPREREVRHWLSQGKSNEEIALILGISPHTVKNHLNNLFDKLGVNNRYAAALAEAS
ncbi:MAG: hypothetical protein CMO55_08745 [Verrucomicrobiales bacterium]|nr:hypothetical protein [Verrucomicrobiales bacterium]